jgi:hypothetical protein
MFTQVTADVIASGSVTPDKLASSLAARPALSLNGNFGGDVLYTASQQVLNSTHFVQRFSRGGITWNGTTGQVTVTDAGYYQITLNMYQNGATSGRFQIRKNGALMQLMHVPASASGVWSVSLIENMTASQYIDVIADSFALGTFYLGPAHSSFHMQFLG